MLPPLAKQGEIKFGDTQDLHRMNFQLYDDVAAILQK
jgi:hypothetical protein